MIEIPILAYHHIVADDEPGELSRFSVTRSQFESQMRYLYEQHYQCVSLQELVDAATGRAPAQQKLFALTFDDGYEDFLTQAYPVIRSFGFTATVFLVTDLVGKVSRWDGEQGSPLLTWEQIRTLAKENITFGSHTCTHPHLPALPARRIENELAISKERLEERLGQEISLLSYPYGESDDVVQRVAGEIGYRAAFGVATGSSGPFNIWRSECDAGETLTSFRFQLSPLHRTLKRWRIFLREQTVLGHLVRRVRAHGFSRSVRQT